MKKYSVLNIREHSDNSREKLPGERKRPYEREPIFREKSPPVQHEQMNGSPEMDLQPEFDRHAEREGRNSRLYDEKPR